MTEVEAEEFARFLTLEQVGFIEKNAPGMELEVALHFLSMFIGHLVYRSLSNEPAEEDATDKEREDFAFQSYLNMKYNIEGATSAGFKGAMETWAGKYCEYMTTISPIPKSVNKKPC